MERQLVIHVGDCKTGSTVVQTMLASDAVTVPGRRWIYPTDRNHSGLARSLNERPATAPQRWSNLARRIEGRPWDMAVLSSELFEFSAPRKLAAALQTYLPDLAETARVIVYVRPHAGRVLSQFAENLKLGHETGSFADFYDRFEAAGRLRYAPRMERWRRVFGDRLTVRPFVRERLARGDIRHDILEQLFGAGGYALDEAKLSVDENPSLTLPDLVLLRRLQQKFRAAKGYRNEMPVIFGKQFGRILAEMPSAGEGEPLRLPQELYDRMAEHASGDAQEMDDTWIGAPCFVPALQEAGQKTVPQAQSLEAEDHHDAFMLRMTDAWAELQLRQMTGGEDDFARRLRPDDPRTPHGPAGAGARA
ncbi:hypothetical protein [Chachezhania sediminis]|uniref:hypothetical protein n=1 Tax=Chachezhania sediminis TaxID=2599291 RepID=UPI00131BFDB7|nr:hypothetical protein [Chachezhania sediminis]